MDFCWLVEVEVQESGDEKERFVHPKEIKILSSGFLRGPHKHRIKQTNKQSIKIITASSDDQPADPSESFSFHAFFLFFVFHFIDDERLLFSSPGGRIAWHGQ